MVKCEQVSYSDCDSLLPVAKAPPAWAGPFFEKPSVGRGLAAALAPSGRPDRHSGYLTAGSDYIVRWAFGHLVTLAEPEAYDPAWKRWAWETLPCCRTPFA